MDPVGFGVRCPVWVPGTVTQSIWYEIPAAVLLSNNLRQVVHTNVPLQVALV